MLPIGGLERTSNYEGEALNQVATLVASNVIEVTLAGSIEIDE